MKKIFSVHPIGNIFIAFDQVFYSKRIDADYRRGLYAIDGQKEKCHLDLNAWVPRWKHDLLFTQPKNGENLYVIDKEMQALKIYEGLVYYDTMRQYLQNYFKFEIKVNGVYLPMFVDKDLNISQKKTDYDLETPTRFIYKGFSRTTVQGYTLQEELVWEREVSGFGKCIVWRNHTPNEEKNEIEGDILGDGQRVYIPLKGGQILALDAETGDVAWFWEYGPPNRYSKAMAYYHGKIYANDGNYIYMINAETGKTILMRAYKNYPVIDFGATGNDFGVFEKEVVLKNQINHSILFLDNQTLDFVDYVETGVHFGSNSSQIIWHKNRLYVHDINNMLTIFEKE